MGFDPSKTDEFLHNFDTVKQQIRNAPGNRFLELYRDKNDPSVFFTYSHWDSPDALEAYRNSELFREVWAFTKKLFNQKPEAWSVETLASLA